ncbi:MAG: UDP-N-acetylglucosamine 1-carboxyvinyltransferase [Actinobacteria bacterium HGW-Actinobacteria-10]|jgi:UDP-N-acetylglucosamine 1-carboxyvinyltransferase|nr:MAG: UDP-N-acetylglucosamine 1-carboxyvinyltransferase [Actinobacteria bacterium HGW-Actinobacteria-10]
MKAEHIRVRGPVTLSGEVRVEGAKNSALKLMAAALMAPGTSRITNVPDISDVDTMAQVLRGLGAGVDRTDHSLTIDATELTSFEAPYEMVARMRASISVLGPLIARLGQARVAMPGGCAIGSRKIDMHIRGLEVLGVHVELGHGYIHATAPDGLIGAHVNLGFPSVGATENLLMAAVLARGTTEIANAAREPEIADLAAFLTGMGARIEGAGSPVITVQGVPELHPVEHRVVGDRIEAGTFLVAGALGQGPVRVRGFDPSHLELVLDAMSRAGCTIALHDDGATVSLNGRATAVDVQTLPFPGFPTDLQAQFMALMAVADGSCVITENVFENRFMFADEIVRMGADVRIDSHHALVRGVPRLSGAPVRSPDLRGGAALVLAGLVAEGETIVSDTYHIERGYERFVEKLHALGADIDTLGEAGAGSGDAC